MKRKRLLMLMAVVMLVGCGSTDTTDNTRETETLQTEDHHNRTLGCINAGRFR